MVRLPPLPVIDRHVRSWITFYLTSVSVRAPEPAEEGVRPMSGLTRRERCHEINQLIVPMTD
ncbi:MAG: hypothetical protein RL119_553 [Actinomycetota bacterium]